MIKKSTKWLSLISVTFLLSSCGLFNTDTPDEDAPENPTEEVVDQNGDEDSNADENTNEDSTSDEINQNLNAWMPRLNDVIYSYEGIGIEYATYTWNPQFNQENYYQTVTNNGGTVLAEVFEYSDNQIVRVLSRPETYFRDNFSSIGISENNRIEEIVLMQPIEVGTSWTSRDSELEITKVHAEIEVPAGTYNTIEVTETFEDTVIKRYYAEDIGLVYEVNETAGETVESLLAEIRTDTPETLPITVYKPDDQAMGLETMNAELSLATNDPARVAIAELFRGDNENYSDFFIFPEGAEMNYLFLNNSNVVEVDLTSEYVSNMNAGSSGESLFLQSLSETLINYYGAESILLTIEGEPYSSGHY